MALSHSGLRKQPLRIPHTCVWWEIEGRRSRSGKNLCWVWFPWPGQALPSDKGELPESLVQAPPHLSALFPAPPLPPPPHPCPLLTHFPSLSLRGTRPRTSPAVNSKVMNGPIAATEKHRITSASWGVLFQGAVTLGAPFLPTSWAIRSTPELQREVISR